MTQYVRSEFTLQFKRLRDILNRDDVDALQQFIRDERFILVVDGAQMELLTDTDMNNTDLGDREKILPVLICQIYESGVEENEQLLVKFLAHDPTRNPSVFIQPEIFVISSHYRSIEQGWEVYKPPYATVTLFGTILHVDDHRDELPHCKSWKCLTYLTEAPQSYNVDLIEKCGLTALQFALSKNEISGAVDLASFSNELRPYPVTFEIQDGDKLMDVPLSYLLWPQSARLIQPQHMKSQVDKINRTALSHKSTGEFRETSNLPKYDKYIHIGLIYELLLANSELINFDMTGDGGLPYDDIVTLDSTRMWPIKPVCRDRIADHSECHSFLACIESEWSWDNFLSQQSYRQRIYDSWKVHRFVDASSGSGSKAGGSIGWGPLSLKDSVRLIIRRCMVQRVESLIFDPEETLQPNQAKLMRSMKLSEHLREFLLFTNIPFKVPDGGWNFRRLCPVATAKYGEGFAIDGGFTPYKALSLHRSGLPRGLFVINLCSPETWRIDPTKLRRKSNTHRSRDRCHLQ